MRQASFKYEMPRLEPKSSQIFLAIKRCERTKIGYLLSDHEAIIEGGCISATIGVKLLNSLTAMVAYVRPLKIELRENVVSLPILVRF
jgi:hypothetical protein